MSAVFPKFGTRTRWPLLISETGLKFLIWTQGKIHPGNWASRVNRAHMKRPLDEKHRMIAVQGIFVGVIIKASGATLKVTDLLFSFAFWKK